MYRLFFLFMYLKCEFTLLGGDNGSKDNISYSAVIDAGSTGTRLHIFGYFNDRLKHQATFTNTPGLASLKNYNDVSQLLNELFLQAGTVHKDIRSIPLGFYGTAGFRALEKERLDELLKVVKSALKGYNVKDIKVLDGKDEAKFAMLALTLSLDNNDFKKIDEKGELTNKNIGILDMGGKSVQISALLKNGIHLSESLDIGLTEGNVKEEDGCIVENTTSQKKCADAISSKLKRVKRHSLLNNLDDLYLLSFFHDELNRYSKGKKVTLSDIKKQYFNECKSLKEKSCRNVFYLLYFMKNLGLNNNINLMTVNNINGINIAWSSGKGYEINRQYNPLK